LEILQEETDRGWRDKEIASVFIRIQKSKLAGIAERSAEDDGLYSISKSLGNLQSQLTQ
jgi:hypothetical protein